MSAEHVALLGGGTWGCTLAALLAKNGHKPVIWEYNPEVAKKLEKERSLATLPGFVLPEGIQVTNDLGRAVDGKNVIFSVTPSHTVRSTFEKARKSLAPGTLVVSATKGIEIETLKTMSQIVREIFTEAGDIVILSGPSHAEEVAQGQPVALVAASPSNAAVRKVMTMTSSSRVRVYPNQDPLGVEVAGALKNVYAVAAGITDGLSLGDNVKAALITRGLAEMTRLGVRMKASALTFFGLAGLGDMIVTCGSKHSRNRRLGEMIGKGATLNEALEKMTMVAEGVKTTASAYALAKKYEVETPIINEMHQILFENKKPNESLKALMEREVGSEMEGIEV